MKIWIGFLIAYTSILATAAETKLDSRCIAPKEIDDKNETVVKKFNDVCETEQEVVRLTNLNRARYKLPPLEIDRELTYVVRYQATLSYREHAYFHEGFQYSWYKEWFPHGNEFFLVGENAWPPAYQGKQPKEIAFNLADSTAPASDGNPKGWNHHPGHAQNTLAANATHIAVGVDIRPDGSATAYTEFEQRKK